MKARIGNQGHGFYGVNALDMRTAAKRSLEWDLNDWKWDGDLFIASPLNPMPSSSTGRQFIPLPMEIQPTGNSSNSSSLCSDEVSLEIKMGKREFEKKRRVLVIEDDNQNDDEVGSLSLKLGGCGYPICGRNVQDLEGDGGKKTKSVGGSRSLAVCQVEECVVDLSNAKDYHRRHKVCEMHSKARKAIVGNLMQRFCQQCSRFHVLQEFDEGKRSCRRRLAGHNKRRRKTNPDGVANASFVNDDQTSGYLLISLLKILSNMHTNRSDPNVDQDLLSQILKRLAGHDDGERNIQSPLEDSQSLLKTNVSHGNSEAVTLLSKGEGSSRSLKEHLNIAASGMTQEVVRGHNSNGVITQNPPILEHNVSSEHITFLEVRGNAAGNFKNNFDLNDMYNDLDDRNENADKCPAPANVSTNSLDCPSWLQQNSHQSSPPQTSGNSYSTSSQSPSSSSRDPQSRTDRIVFKLFGKEPKDLPFVLRAQILDWLAHGPNDIEGYIRPGCLILTVYLRQPEFAWEELCCDLGSSLRRLLDASEDSFWRTGWFYVRVQQEIAIVYNGQVVVDESLPPTDDNYSEIISLKPIALSVSKKAQFLVKGINLCRLRLFCMVEGNYLVEENADELVDCVDNSERHDELQCIKFSCAAPSVAGRGFIEIEDSGFSSSFFPIIVAEEDVCLEIRMLEDALDFPEADAAIGFTEKMKAKYEALDFIHEMGWLLHRSQSKSRLGHLDPNSELFPLSRFKSLMEFSLDHEWCAVVKNLMNILLNGIVGTGDHSSAYAALSEMGILHKAVRRNSRSLVDFLLRYVPEKLESETEVLVRGGHGSFLFRPDVTGPAGLTPLHIAAGKDDSEDVLDALTNDPEMEGIKAWKNALDSTGSTPEDYACLRGHYSYIHLVQKKINRRSATSQVVLDIPGLLLDKGARQKRDERPTASLEIGQTALRTIQKTNCMLCRHEVSYVSGRLSLLYRPAMLSMVAIAAVCVCVALLFKSCPEVVFVFRPFRWELLDYGTC